MIMSSTHLFVLEEGVAEQQRWTKCQKNEGVLVLHRQRYLVYHLLQVSSKEEGLVQAWTRMAKGAGIASLQESSVIGFY